jgi:hypothetical protein
MISKLRSLRWGLFIRKKGPHFLQWLGLGCNYPMLPNWDGTFYQEVTLECKIQMRSYREDGHARKTSREWSLQEKMRTHGDEGWEMFSKDLLYKGGEWGSHWLSETQFLLWILRKIMHVLSASHLEWITLASTHHLNAKADRAWSTQLQPVNLKLPLMLISDKDNCFHLFKLRHRREKVGQNNAFILQVWIYCWLDSYKLLKMLR